LSRSDKIHCDVANFCPNCEKEALLLENTTVTLRKWPISIFARRLVRGASYADLSAQYPATFDVKKSFVTL
jgi:hypothetical protein